MEHKRVEKLNMQMLHYTGFNNRLEDSARAAEGFQVCLFAYMT